MPTFRRGDVIRVPFPYTNRDVWQHRPAVVVSAAAVGDASRLIWVLMITSARNRPWPGDLLVEGYEEAGLPAPSVIRTAKIATAELSDATIVGQISANTLALVDDHLRRTLGLR